ncbi:heat stress transcription factor B-2c-like [Mercurialis annua]|uniref:heat stress transcription factor B-2c-like n=1 Tax=Mercurialis annua TaxID=3986 RepID=UPI0021604F28|nr:heat stress transcription factor B-2c-like [Mercurialis annua]
MAPPPGDLNCDVSTTADTHRAIPTPFLTKTYQLVEDPAIDDVISWNDDGSTFVVWNPTVFARDLLPMYFKHNNFSSFVRQLNTYGFRKVVPDRWEFSNDCFRRDEKKLLGDIHRRKIHSQAAAAATTTAPAVVPVTPAAKETASPSAPVAAVAAPTVKPIVSTSSSGEEQVISANSSSQSGFSGQAEVFDENDRLKKENIQLSKELTEMKSLCTNIFSLVSGYGANEGEGLPPTMPPDLISFHQLSGEGEETENSARLFGVTIGMKRGRESEDSRENETQLHLQQPGGSNSNTVRAESLDRMGGGVNGDDHYVDDEESTGHRSGSRR